MRILAVDDEKGYLCLLGDLLRGYGFDVLLAENGKQARELLEGEKIDMIISDIHMPTLDGVGFHSYVREFTEARESPFIFISGMDDAKTRGAVVKPGLDFFLKKTTPVDEIVSLIRSLEVSIAAKSI